MIEICKNNPIIKRDVDTPNYSFVTYDEDLYWIKNTIVGDDAYKKNAVIPAGEFLNGFLVKAWEGQRLVVDGKHIEGGVAALAEGDVLVAAEDGKLVAGEAAGVHFVVKEKTVLTEEAVEVKIVVA